MRCHRSVKDGACHSTIELSASCLVNNSTGNNSSFGPSGLTAPRTIPRTHHFAVRTTCARSPPSSRTPIPYTTISTIAIGNDPWVFTQTHITGTSQRGSRSSSRNDEQDREADQPEDQRSSPPRDVAR